MINILINLLKLLMIWWKMQHRSQIQEIIRRTQIPEQIRGKLAAAEILYQVDRNLLRVQCCKSQYSRFPGRV
jgi:hypothetical protein